MEGERGEMGMRDKMGCCALHLDTLLYFMSIHSSTTITSSTTMLSYNNAKHGTSPPCMIPFVHASN